MKSSLDQNERMGILARGQLGVASRTLEEMQAGGTDTHNLAVAAGQQAEAAGTAAKASQSESNTTREALTSVQRAFVYFIGNISIAKTIVAGKTTELVLTMPWQNAGVTPTKNARSQVNWINLIADLPASFPFPDMGKIEARQFEISSRGFGNATLAIPVPDFDAAKRGKFRLFMWGWVTYNDIFDKTPTHLSEFCDEMTDIKSTPDDLSDPSANITSQLTLCHTHNCFDEQCADYSQRILAKY